VISRLPAACIRAALVALLVLLPPALLGGGSAQVTDALVLIAIAGALFVILEYGSTYPGLVEFRDAPPFNRVRFGMLLMMLLLVALVCRGIETPTTLTRLVTAIGLLLGEAMDFPLSPVRLMMGLLAEGTPITDAYMMRVAAGLCYLIALMGLTVFAIMIRLHNWPSPRGRFNVWVNLPTFDPTAGADVVVRLNRDGAVNIALGLALPYLAPLVAAFVAGAYDISLFASDLLLVWTMALWAFLPASLFLRGIAMRRLALMISQKRRRYGAEMAQEDPDFLPA
jgi:hypothetical protein